MGIHGLALKAGEASSHAAGALHHPNIIRVGERDFGGAHGRSAQQASGFGAERHPSGETERHQAKNQNRAFEHQASIGRDDLEPVYNLAGCSRP